MPRSRSRKRGTRRTSRAYPRGVLKVSGAGYGFVQTSEGEFFVPASKMADAFDGDLVEVSRVSASRSSSAVVASAERPTARVVRVIGRAHEDIVGRYCVAEPFGIVVPEDPRIKHDVFTMRREAPHVQDGDIVRVRMTVYPSRREPAQGVVEEVLGHEGDAGIDVDLIVARHKLETSFSEETLEQVSYAQVEASRALAGDQYRDYTDRVIFTIDPDDAKDFDDALSLDQVDGLTRLGVHIADVSHYVPWNSPADQEARRRATSVYLVDRVIPMLPEKLSNDVCSLRPNEERRALSVDMFFDDAGDVVRVDIAPSVIKSCARLTYGQVQACLDAFAQHDDVAAYDAVAVQAGSAAPEVMERIAALDKVAKGLHAQRVKRGGMDFESVEAKVRLDAEGHPLDVVLRTKNDATSLVEEAMIAANEAVARFLRDKGQEAIYRVHEAPAPADLKDLKPILQEFGYDKRVPLSQFTTGNPFAIQKVLNYARGRVEEFLVSSLIVRSMKRAVYVNACERHFGLASDAYLHFTSPIRRYPDLVAHRMVKVALFGRLGTTSAEEAALARIAEHSSKQERKAEEAARESQELKLYELLEQRVGEEEEGMVSGVTASGFFVRLHDTAEGFVSLRDVGEYFILDPARRVLTGSDTGMVFRLGMRVRIRVDAVYPYERRADFKLLERRRKR